MWFVMLTVICLALALLTITMGGNVRPAYRTDCIIVPGAACSANGQPGPMLAARISNAVRLYEEGWGTAIIFTGGAGESGPVESIVARAAAARLGVPLDRMHVETLSHSTYENFLYARALMEEHHWQSCLVSTDPFHVLRCVVIARHLGLRAFGAPAFESPGYTRARLRVWYTLRECAGFARDTMALLSGH